jgi:amino acid transporter
MKSENTSQLSDQELLEKIKKAKSHKIINAVLIGFTVGIFVYSAVKNGFGFFTFFPLILTYIFIKSASRYNAEVKELQNELNSRNLL